jgi:hypothetical protein
MVTLIVGLPGSGKTYHAKQLAEKTQAMLFDDITKNDLLALYEALESNKDCIITDPFLCNPNIRAMAITNLNQYVDDINIIYLENNINAALYNVKKRNDGRIIHSRWIKELSEIYTIPDNAEIRKIRKFPQ